jgi:hypothetical protein
VRRGDWIATPGIPVPPDPVAAALADVRRQIFDEGTRIHFVIEDALATTPMLATKSGGLRPFKPEKDLFGEFKTLRSLMEREHALMLMQTYPDSMVILDVKLVSVITADGAEQAIPVERIPDVGVVRGGTLNLVECKTEKTIVGSIARYGKPEMVAAYRRSSHLGTELRNEAEFLASARRLGVSTRVKSISPLTGQAQEDLFDLTRIKTSRPQAYGIIGDIPPGTGPARPKPPLEGPPTPGRESEPSTQPAQRKPAAPAEDPAAASRSTPVESRATGGASRATTQAADESASAARSTTQLSRGLEQAAEGATSAWSGVARAFGAGVLAGLKGALKGGVEGVAYEALAKLVLLPIGNAYRDAQIARASRGLRDGFIAGVSAQLLGRDAGWVREHLRRPDDAWSVTPEIHADFADAVGLEEHYYNVGLSLGVDHAHQLPPGYSHRLQRYVFDRMKAHNEHISDRVEEFPSEQTIYRAGYYLQTYADPELAKILAAARQRAQAAEREAQRQREEAGVSGFPIHSMKQ